jgi:hypothetical protein
MANPDQAQTTYGHHSPAWTWEGSAPSVGAHQHHRQAHRQGHGQVFNPDSIGIAWKQETGGSVGNQPLHVCWDPHVISRIK